MKLVVAIAFCWADFQNARRLLEWIEHLGTQKGNDCLLVVDAALYKSKIEPIAKAARRVFNEVELTSPPFSLPDEKWPAGANWMFEAAIRHLCNGENKRPFLWLEPDCVPTRATWLEEIQSAYARSKSPFMGQVFLPKQTGLPEQMLSGIAVYPAEMPLAVSQKLIGKRKVAWDVSCADIVAPKTTHSDLFWTFHNRANPPTFVVEKTKDSPPNAIELRQIPSRAAIVHPCKDGSLINILRENTKAVTNWKESKTMAPARPADYANAPSFTQQTDWPCGFFFFPATPKVKTCYFNPTLATVGGADYLIVRRSVTPYQNFWQSDLGIWRIGKNMVPMDPLFPALPRTGTNENWEDPRAVVHGEKVFISVANWTHFKPFKCQQILARWTGSKMEVVLHPEYGGNSQTPAKQGRAEKNWTFFVHDGLWHFVYASSPVHEVVRIDEGGKLSVFKDSLTTEKVWDFGEMRGGSCPVRVGEEYVCFFHSSESNFQKGIRRRYFMGAYCFSALVPFRITRITRTPLLAGSTKDPANYPSPPCVFPGGAMLRDGTWTVVGGANDENSFWIKIPHADLEARLEAV